MRSARQGVFRRVTPREHPSSAALSGVAEEDHPDPRCDGPGRLRVEDPGDDRLSRQSTIMGPAGLTAVFGMGTGVAPPVWSPGIRPAGGQARRPRSLRWSVTHESVDRMHTHRGRRGHAPRDPVRIGELCRLATASIGRRLRRGGPIGVVKRSAVRTGRLRRSPAVHARPIDLVVFQEPSQHSLLETSSRRGLRA